MGRVGDPERHEQVFNLLACVHSDAVCNALDPDIGRVLEEGDGWATLKDGLKEGDMVGVRLEDAVGESGLLLRYEALVERVADNKLFDFILGERDRVGALFNGR